jgi:hypothetical protein
MASNNNQNINPRPCVYNCGIQIYWNTATSEYWEVLTKKKHICPNRVSKSIIANNNTSAASVTTSTKPTYNSKKPWNTQPKPKMSNSFELLTGPIDTLQKKYEILSDIITEYNGKTHGSQSHNVTNNSMQLIVYYEVPLGMRVEVKRKFDNLVRKTITLQRNY